MRAALAMIALVALFGALPTGPAVANAQAAGSGSGEEAPSPGQVNLNTATEAELQRLPGVGPARARAIVQRRTRRPFRRIRELMSIRGIGRRTFRRLRPMLTLTGPTTLR